MLDPAYSSSIMLYQKCPCGAVEDLGLEDLYLTKRINKNMIYIHTNTLTREHLPVHINIQLTGICTGSII